MQVEGVGLQLYLKDNLKALIWKTSLKKPESINSQKSELSHLYIWTLSTPREFCASEYKSKGTQISSAQKATKDGLPEKYLDLKDRVDADAMSGVQLKFRGM